MGELGYFQTAAENMKSRAYILRVAAVVSLMAFLITIGFVMSAREERHLEANSKSRASLNRQAMEIQINFN